jgi:hypothetical protein
MPGRFQLYIDRKLVGDADYIYDAVRVQPGAIDECQSQGSRRWLSPWTNTRTMSRSMQTAAHGWASGSQASIRWIARRLEPAGAELCTPGGRGTGLTAAP